MKAFISYSRQDDEFATTLVRSLAQYGIHAWKDVYQIRIGERFDIRIFDAINDSDAFVVLLSPNAERSEWVERELAHALDQFRRFGRLRIFPLLLSDCQIPEPLRDLSFADFRKDFEQPLRKLIADIRQEDIDHPTHVPTTVASRPYRDTQQNEAIRMYNLGVAAYQRGDLTKALECFDKAFDLDPHNYDSFYNAAVTAYELAQRTSGEGLYRSVVERYEQVLKLRPDDVDAMVNLGVIYNTHSVLGQPERARSLFEKAVQLAPDYALAWLNLGHYYGFAGGGSQLQDAGNRIDHDGVDNTVVKINPAFLQKAIESYQRAIDLNPEFQRMFPATMRAIKLFTAVLNSAQRSANSREKN